MSVIKFILSIVDITIIPHFLLYDYFKVHFFRLTPSNIPTKSSISESEQAELEEFIYNAKILVNALGHKVFENYSNTETDSSNDVFYISVGTGKAIGKPTSDGFVLLKGSDIHQNSAESISDGIKKKVIASRKNGEIQDNILTVDKLFSSSSAAAQFAVGYSISGPGQWKNKNGTTLKSYETQKKN